MIRLEGLQHQQMHHGMHGNSRAIHVSTDRSPAPWDAPEGRFYFATNTNGCICLPVKI